MPRSSARFDDRVAVITGATRGIGLAIARILVDEGARVCITGRKQDSLDAALTYLGDAAIGVVGKVDDPEHRSQVLAATAAAFGRIDLLVNNAAVNPVYGPVLEASLDAARKIVEVNALGAVAWTKAALETGLGSHPGAAVGNVSSAAALLPSSGIGLYGASKAMLDYLTRQLAFELAPTVRVNAVAPAVVRTAFSSALYAGREDEVAATYPMRRLGETSDISAAVAFLLSDESSWITGQVLVIDGGLTLTGGI